MTTDVSKLFFRRKFSTNFYKNKRLVLGGMSFAKDFVTDKRGDLYPLVKSTGEFSEKAGGGEYSFSSDGGAAARLIGSHFPYESYRIKADIENGECGVLIMTEKAELRVTFKVLDGKIVICSENGGIHTDCCYHAGMSFIVSCRPGAFDVYFEDDGHIRYAGTLHSKDFSGIDSEKLYKSSTASLYVSGCARVCQVEAFIDCGVSQADVRPVRYENGDILVENGRAYITMSVRLEAGYYQGVFSWIPGTEEFELVGVLFFDAGDGVCCNDVASSVVFDRNDRLWKVWYCSFAHGHVLGFAQSAGDVRFGLNVLDCTLMEKMEKQSSDRDFLGKEGDEDPDFLYDEKSGKWYLTVCRLVSCENGANYRYFLFESEKSFCDGFSYVTNALDGSETGGSIVKVGGGYNFVCGSDYEKRAQYHVYKLPDLKNYDKLKCDFDDGGFRGWGTVMPIVCGTRKRYFWLTFDRHNASEYNWSYGNLYLYEADEYEKI